MSIAPLCKEVFPIRCQVDLSVRQIGPAYQVTLTRPLTSAQLYCTDRPQGGHVHCLGAFDMPQRCVMPPVPMARPYFIVRSQDSPDLVAADRLVNLPGVENFRDLGGYMTQGGAMVKWGRFFRGGVLEPKTPADRANLDALGLKTIFDYRTDEEAGQRPDHVSPGARHMLSSAVIGLVGTGNHFASANLIENLRSIHSQQDAEALWQEFIDMYRIMPFDNPAYRAMLACLDHGDQVPLYQHCAAGKDRTGVGCALLLLALGVDEETVIGDYLLSGPCRHQDTANLVTYVIAQGIPEPSLPVLHRTMGVERELIAQALGAIRQRYGTYEAYFEAEHDAGPARLGTWRSMHTA